MNNIKLRILFLIEDIKTLLLFIRYIPGYYKLHRDYLYKPTTYDFIIQNYEEVLCNRTKVLSKPTYGWKTVVKELDRYYEEIYEEENNNEHV